MTITAFARKVAAREGGKRQVNIAQIAEILKIVDDLTLGVLYCAIRLLK